MFDTSRELEGEVVIAVGDVGEELRQARVTQLVIGGVGTESCPCAYQMLNFLGSES